MRFLVPSRLYGSVLYFFLSFLGLFSGLVRAQAPNGLRTIATREQPSSVLYDANLTRFYASVPTENSVYVIAESTGAVIAKVPVNNPGALALSPDGSHLFVATSITVLGGGGSVGYYSVSTATLHASDYVPTVINQTTVNNRDLGYTPATLPVSLAALSTGKILFVGEPVGITGGELFLSDPATRLATQVVDVNFYNGILTGSRDGSTVASAAVNSASVHLELRGSDASSIAYLNFSTANSSDIALSPDGKTLAVGGKYLFTNKLTQMQTLPVASGSGSQGSVFSPDGSRLYVLTNANFNAAPAIAVYSPASAQLLGYVPIPAPTGGTLPEAIAAGSSGKVLVITGNGLLELDASAPSATMLPVSNLASFSLSPDGGVVSGTPSVSTISLGNSRSPSIFFGQTPAAVTSSTASYITVQPPISSAAGTVPVSLLFNDGSTATLVNGYSYGPTIQRMSVTAGASTGGTIVKLNGLGLGTSTGFPTVTLGGAAATVTAFTSSSAGDVVTFTTPAGKVGFADLGLSSYAGSVTRPAAFQYCAHTLVPSVIPYQMVLDPTRNQLYVADYPTSSVLVIDGASLMVRTLYKPASGAPTSLALTPDGSSLLVVSYAGDTLDVVDPVSGILRKTLVPNPGSVAGPYSPNSVAATARGTALVSLNDTGLIAGTLVEVNLATGAVSPVSTGTRFDAEIPATLFASNAAGDHIAMAGDGALEFSPLTIGQWQSAADAVAVESSQEASTFQIATDDLGDITLQDSSVLDAHLNQFSNLAPDSTLAAARTLVYGQRLHSSGALAYTPTTLGVELADIHHGNTVLSLGVPEGSFKGNDNLAISHTGSRLYYAQPNGIGVFDLPSVPLSVGSLTPAVGPAAGGTTVLLRGSGFTSATTVMLDGQPTNVSLIDSTQLTFVTPPVSAAKVALTLTNPGLSSYSLDLAFDASANNLPAPPVLSSISPSNASTGSSLANLLLQGTNFTPGMQVLLNGAAIETTYQNSSQAFVAYSNIAGPGQQAVTAQNLPNPVPSNTIYITTTTISASAILGSFTPSFTTAGSPSFTLVLYVDAGLQANSVALWNGLPLASTAYGSTYLYATVPAALVATAGTASISIGNPGLAASNAYPFTIRPAVAMLTLSPATLSFSPVLVGNSSTATATLTSTGSASASVSSIALSNAAFSQTNNCTQPLAQGQSCTITVTFKPVALGSATDTLTVVSNAATLTSTHSASSGDLAISAGTLPAISAGQSTSTTLAINTSGGVPTSTVQIACSAGLPAGAACQFYPSSIAIGPGSATASVTLNITTAAGTRSMLEPFGKQRTVWLAGLLVGAGLLTRRRRLRSMLLLCCSLALATTLVACSGSSSGNGSGGGGALTGNTPAGSYPITLTTTSGGNVHTVVVTLSVQ